MCGDVHKHDGTLLSTVTDTAVIESILRCYIETPHKHNMVFAPGDYVYALFVKHTDIVNTKMQAWQVVLKNVEMLKEYVRFDHPHAMDGKHHIMFVVINYGPGGEKQSMASGYIPKQ